MPTHSFIFTYTLHWLNSLFSSLEKEIWTRTTVEPHIRMLHKLTNSTDTGYILHICSLFEYFLAYNTKSKIESSPTSCVQLKLMQDLVQHTNNISPRLMLSSYFLVTPDTLELSLSLVGPSQFPHRGGKSF